MEYWESKADDGLILYTDPCHHYKNRSHSAIPSIPTFQYSIIPVPLAGGLPIILCGYQVTGTVMGGRDLPEFRFCLKTDCF
jgi:hypothetical protein